MVITLRKSRKVQKWKQDPYSTFTIDLQAVQPPDGQDYHDTSMNPEHLPDLLPITRVDELVTLTMSFGESLPVSTLASNQPGLMVRTD